jgi:hypothetical protein
MNLALHCGSTLLTKASDRVRTHHSTDAQEERWRLCVGAGTLWWISLHR